MWLQIRTFVGFRHLRFEVLLLVLNRDQYFHLLWRQFGMSNPAKRDQLPSGNPAKKTATAHQARSRENLVPVRNKATSGHL